jgi:hypothetical protein
MSFSYSDALFRCTPAITVASPPDMIDDVKGGNESNYPQRSKNYSAADYILAIHFLSHLFLLSLVELRFLMHTIRTRRSLLAYRSGE